MNKAILPAVSILALLWAADASAQNAKQAYWQGARTTGHGIGYCDTGSGVNVQDSSITNCGVLSYGTPLYPIYQQSINATISITNGSTSFTAPTGLAINVPGGSVPGDTMYATDIPLCSGFRPTVLTYSSSTGAGTMTCPATATTTTEAVRFGDGTRFDPGSSNLVNTVAAQGGRFGDAAQYRTWWPASNPAYGANLVNSGASLEVGANAGSTVAAAIMTHSLDNVSGNSIALNIHTLADATSGSHSLWGIYEQIDTVGSAVANNAGTSAGEIEIANRWPTTVIDPFNVPANSTVEWSFGSGAGQAATNLWGTLNPASAAVYVFPNNAKFESGIVFNNGALDTTQVGGFAPALALGINQSVSFYGATGQKAWNVYSSGANAGNTGNLVFGAAAVTLSDTPGMTFNVESEGAGQSRLEVNNSTAAQDATAQFAEAGAFKWKVGKRGSDLAFMINDITNNANVMLVTTGGNTTLGETIANSTIQGAAVILQTVGGKQAQVNNVATSVDFLTMSGGAAGSPGQVVLGASGTDTDINIAFLPKGAGVLKVGASSGVTCAAGTVSTTTMVVTSGLVTHC